tara:strand:+ start:73 stop:366 length:294 start_codon:yes stop_codon:yes gene_type:complete
MDTTGQVVAEAEVIVVLPVVVEMVELVAVVVAAPRVLVLMDLVVMEVLLILDRMLDYSLTHMVNLGVMVVLTRVVVEEVLLTIIQLLDLVQVEVVVV